MDLIEYINKYYGGNQSAFAAAFPVSRSMVTQWIKGGWIVLNGQLLRPHPEYIILDGKVYSAGKELPVIEN